MTTNNSFIGASAFLLLRFATVGLGVRINPPVFARWLGRGLLPFCCKRVMS